LGLPGDNTAESTNTHNPREQVTDSEAAVDPIVIAVEHRSSPAFDRFERLGQSVRGTISLKIVWSSLAVFLAGIIVSQLDIVSWGTFLRLLAFSYDGLKRWYFFQLITAPFLHDSISRLLFNMLAIVTLGPVLEGALGKRGFVTLCGISAWTGMITFLIMTGDSPWLEFGCSDIIFGLVASQALLFPNQEVLFYGLFPVKMRLAALLIVLLTLYFSATAPFGLSQLSHLAAGMAGWLYVKRLKSRLQ
jgi:membrane associated rhomboid family serine protease